MKNINMQTAYCEFDIKYCTITYNCFNESNVSTKLMQYPI